MNDNGKLKVVAHGERDIVISRLFNASRDLLFDALTKPELLKDWLLGPPGWEMPVCEVDLKVGGAYRYVWRRNNGNEMGSSGVFREIAPPGYLVNTEVFDEPWYPGECLVMTTLLEQDEKTAYIATIRYESEEARDGVMKSGMEKGLATSYDRLEAMLQSTR